MLNALFLSSKIENDKTKSSAIWHFLQRRVAVAAYLGEMLF